MQMLRTKVGTLLLWEPVNTATARCPVSSFYMVSSSVSVVLGSDELVIVQHTCT